MANFHLLICLFGFLAVAAFLSDEMSVVSFWTLFPVSIATLFVLIGGVDSAVRGSVIIDENKVVEVGVFKGKEIELSKIKGFRSNQYCTHLIPIVEDLPKIYKLASTTAI